LFPPILGGRVADLNPIIALARQCGAYVIEDAAQALGARDQGKSVGLRCDAGFFSLAAGKGLSIFEVGLWIAADAELRAELGEPVCRLFPLALAGRHYVVCNWQVMQPPIVLSRYGIVMEFVAASPSSL